MKVTDSFRDRTTEINFSEYQAILGKLTLFTIKLFVIETTTCAFGRNTQSYFENQLKILKSEYKESISIERDFYRTLQVEQMQHS